MNSLRIVPKDVFNRIADDIRQYQLDGIDLHDIAVSIDSDETDYTGAGQELWCRLVAESFYYNVSASDLISEALLVLG